MFSNMKIGGKPGLVFGIENCSCKSGETMTEVVNSIRHVTDTVSEIIAASHEQSSGMKQF